MTPTGRTSASRSMCTTGLVAPQTEGQVMTGLPTSLSIGLWFVGAIWLVGILAFVNDAPGELVWASFLVGLFAGLAEWLAHSRLACAAPHGPFPKGRRPVPAAPHGRPPRPSSAATPPASRAATAPSRPAGAAADGREAPPPSPQRRPPRRHIRPAARRQPDPRARPPRPAPLPARPPPRWPETMSTTGLSPVASSA
jgi:hypothetical protein